MSALPDAVQMAHSTWRTRSVKYDCRQEEHQKLPKIAKEILCFPHKQWYTVKHNCTQPLHKTCVQVAFGRNC